MQTPEEGLDLIPVLNFASMAPVPFKRAMWMIHSGLARPIEGKGIELLFKGLDTAIASDKGPSCAGPHKVAGRVRLKVIEWDGDDPFDGFPAVMMRGNTGGPVSYY